MKFYNPLEREQLLKKHEVFIVNFSNNFQSEIMQLYSRGIKIFILEISQDEKTIEVLVSSCCGNKVVIKTDDIDWIKNAIQNKFKIHVNMEIA